MAVIESRTNRSADARRHAEEAVEFAAHDPDAYPQNTAELQVILARALLHTKGDKKQAKALLATARATFVKIGPGMNASVREIDKLAATIH